VGQVNAFNFQATPQNLAAINGVRPDYMGMVWDWQQRAQQHDQTGLADLMRASQHEATMDPIRVQQGQATLADTQAGTAGKLLNNDAQRMKNEVDAYVLPQAKLQAAKDLILKGSEADEKMFAIEVDKMLRSDDPKQRAYGTQLLNTSRKAVEEKRAAESQRLTNQQRIELEGKQRMREIGAQGGNAKELLQMQIDAGRFTKTDKNAPVTFEQSFTKLKKAHEKHAALIDAARAATQEGNEALAQSYLARADDLRPQAEAELRMLQKPGEVDLSQQRVPGQPIPTTPRESIAPAGAKKPDPLGIR
jgi:hypothetical protein